MNATEFCEQLESLLFSLKNYNPEHPEEKTVQKEIYQSFLYQFIDLLENIQFEMPANRRGINDLIVKTFLKEIFIKHQIQGINFNAWESDDITALNIDYMPQELQNEIKDRKLSVVETHKFWYLIAPVRDFTANRYSICRFLEEDHSYGLYTTYGLCVPRKQINDPKLLNAVLQLLGTIYTLDNSASTGVLKFIQESNTAKNNYIAPLLRQKISHNGNIEESVQERLVNYEDKLTKMILKRLPSVIENATDGNDYFILNHHLDKILGDLWRDLEIFTLLPIVHHTNSAKIMSSRLMSYRLLLEKARPLIWQKGANWKERTEKLNKAFTELTQLANEVVDESQAFQDLLEEWFAYQDKIKEGSFWAKLGIGKPKYTFDEIEEAKADFSEQCFFKIIRLAKKHYDTIIYVEFENPLSSIHDADYRHYAMCYSKNAIDRLPFVVRLPERRSEFDVQAFCQTTNDVAQQHL